MAANNSGNGSNTKPFNVRLIKPSEIIKDKATPKPTNKAKSKTSVRDKTADAARLRATERAQMLRSESAEDRAFRKLMEKYNYDVTKIPGYKQGGTR